MAPRETPKAISKKTRASVTKTNIPKPKSSPINNIKKVTGTRNLTDKMNAKANTAIVNIKETKQSAISISRVMTPKSSKKENKAQIAPGSVTKSAKKPLWKRRPKPAHSGVPVPEKMRRLFEQLQDSD